MERTISKQSTVVATKEVLESDLESETVLLYPRTGEYFSLDEVGSWVWNHIREPRTVEEVQSALLEEFEGVDADRCQADLTALFSQLLSQGLIEVHDAAGR